MKFFAQMRDWYLRSSAMLIVPEGMSCPAIGLLKPYPFRHGVEILNDNQNPMSFVLHALQEHAGLSYGDASAAVAICHNKGGGFIPVANVESAGEIAARISQSVMIQLLPLKCRVVIAAVSKR